jgi:outer membrane lipoprotein-sorting protein
VQTKTNLGLPSLGSLAPGSSDLLTTLLSPQTIKVSAAPGGKFHLAIPNGLAETDVISDGSQVWVWQSSDQSVAHLASSADSGDATAAPDNGVEPTPDAVAKELLANLDPTTRVFVRGTATVAGRDAYELVLSPTSSTTLVADVVIDVDAATSLPLEVQVLAKDAGTPALDVAFSSVSFGAQPDSAFTFTPPPGAKVTEATSPEQLLFGQRRTGPDVGSPGAPPVDGQGTRRQKVVPPGAGAAPAPASPGTAPDAKTQVIGTGWDAVVAIPDGPVSLGAVGRQVSGTWGSGKLVTSTLADALVLDNGTVLVGMVGPDRLEAAVAELHP